ncbi:Pectinesterase/pectinesterase inhibitor, partial [Thalictrum thalictroides]
ITGDRFIARDIGFQNIAGPEGGQALAMDIASDRSVLYRCSIAGYQDTLYAHALRQFYRESDIYGTVDFIFGNAAAVFQNCYLVLRRPQYGAYNVILANGREDPGQSTGFSIQRCRIGAGSDLSPVKHSVESYLGRPWKKYSRSVIMQSIIDDAIRPRGWIEWSNNFALDTLYFAEYSNSGPGASTSNRVKWRGHHVIGAEEAAKFSVANFIGGNTWLPSTGIIFDSGIIA